MHALDMIYLIEIKWRMVINVVALIMNFSR
jgi:hypothetical protein